MKTFKEFLEEENISDYIPTVLTPIIGKGVNMLDQTQQWWNGIDWKKHIKDAGNVMGEIVRQQFDPLKLSPFEDIMRNHTAYHKAKQRALRRGLPPPKLEDYIH